MSEEKTTVKPFSLLRHLATDSYACHSISQAGAPPEEQQEEPLTSDILAFCKLIARIMMRCLRERDPRVMELLSVSSKTKTGDHDAA